MTRRQPISLREKLDQYAKRDESKWSQVENYLSRKRELPLELIRQHRADGSLYPNTRASCVFLHRNEQGIATGATIRSTSGNFKQCIGNKSDGFFTTGAKLYEARSLVLTESPIDALSYRALHPDPTICVISTAGTSNPAVLIQRAQERNQTIIAAQDGDAAGDLQAQDALTIASDLGVQSFRKVPWIGKDWNDCWRWMSRQIHHASTWIKTLSTKLCAAWREEGFEINQTKRQDITNDYSIKS